MISSSVGLANIKWFPDEELSEISQTSKIRFAFVNNKLEQVHPFVLCRDFLHDAMRWYLMDTPNEIYRFRYNKKVYPPIDLERTTMLVEFPAGFKYKIGSVVQLLKYYENYHMGVYHLETFAIKLMSTEGPNTYVLFSSPKKWQTVPCLLSLYTLLIKVAQHTDFDSFIINNSRSRSSQEKMRNDIDKAYRALIEKYDNDCKNCAQPDNELGYLKSVKDFITPLLNSYRKIFDFNEPTGYASCYQDKVSVNKFHNDYGIVGFVKGKYDNFNSNKVNEFFLQSKPDKGLAISKNEKEDVNQSVKNTLDSDTQHGVAMAFVSKENVKEGRFITSKFKGIGSGLISSVMLKALEDSRGKDIDLNKLRLVVTSNDTTRPQFKEKMFVAKRFINFIEESMGIKERTKISSAYFDFTKNYKHTVYLLTGPSVWMASPYFLIMFTTLIDFLTQAQYDVKAFDTKCKNGEGIKPVINDFKEIAKENRNLRSCSLEEFADKIEFIAQNKNIITTDTVKDSYLKLKNVGYNAYSVLKNMGKLRADFDEEITKNLNEKWEKGKTKKKE